MASKLKSSGKIYLALHDAGMRNGSFYRSAGRKQWAQYINGDFMGFVDTRPTTYADLPLVEYDSLAAEKLIPRICGGR